MAATSTFDPSNPSASLPAYPTVADLLIGLQQAVRRANGLVTNFNIGGVTQTYLEACSILLGSDASTLPNASVEGGYELLYEVATAAFASTAVGNDLDLKGADVGVFRKKQQYANAALQLSIPQPATTPGFVIAAGTIFSAPPADPTQGPVLFETTAVATVPTGQTNVPTLTPSAAMIAGSAGNVPAGAINMCVTNGQIIVTNPGKGTGGIDTEPDDDASGGFRARVLAAIPNSAQCTIAAIEDDALQFPITSAVLVENTADDGVTVQLGRGQLYVDDGSGNLGDPTNPNYAAFAALQNAINSGLYRAAGTQVNVRGSVTQAIAITISVTAASQAIVLGATQASIQADVQTAVFNYVSALIMGAPVRIAGIVAAAKDLTYSTTGVKEVSNVDVTSVKINGVNADLIPAVYELPRVSPNISAIVVTVTGTAAN